jgi:hypothetical protein
MGYKKLVEGDTFQRGDEMQSPNTGEWSAVPEQWYGMKVSWSDNNTFSRFGVKVRRKDSGTQPPAPNSHSKQRLKVLGNRI